MNEEFILTSHAIERFNHRFACLDVSEELKTIVRCTSKQRKEIMKRCDSSTPENSYFVSNNNVFFICHDNIVLTVFEHVDRPTKRERNKRRLRYK